VAPSMAIAAGLGAVGGAVGLVVSDLWSIAAGPTICVTLAVAFAVSAVVSPRQGWLARRRHRPASTAPLQRYGLAP
jgi:ABC-type Mn2+/Zn2+ transport system permease subunit